MLPGGATTFEVETSIADPSILMFTSGGSGSDYVKVMGQSLGTTILNVRIKNPNPLDEGITGSVTVTVTE